MILYDRMENETNKEYGYRVIKDNIMNLNLKPGELLSEAELSKQLNLSRTPIREILSRLKNEHLIEVKSQVGTYVSLINYDLIEEAIFMRYVIEKEVLKEACANMSADILMELEKNLFAQKLIVKGNRDDIEFHRLDVEFHKLLFKAVNKINIWNSILAISTHYNRMRLLSEMNRDKNNVIEEHERYLEIIKDKLNNEIEYIVDKHIKQPSYKWKNDVIYTKNM